MLSSTARGDRRVSQPARRDTGSAFFRESRWSHARVHRIRRKGPASFYRQLVLFDPKQIGVEPRIGHLGSASRRIGGVVPFVPPSASSFAAVRGAAVREPLADRTAAQSRRARMIALDPKALLSGSSSTRCREPGGSPDPQRIRHTTDVRIGQWRPGSYASQAGCTQRGSGVTVDQLEFSIASQPAIETRQRATVDGFRVCPGSGVGFRSWGSRREQFTWRFASGIHYSKASLHEGGLAARCRLGSRWEEICGGPFRSTRTAARSRSSPSTWPATRRREPKACAGNQRAPSSAGPPEYRVAFMVRRPGLRSRSTQSFTRSRLSSGRPEASRGSHPSNRSILRP